MSRTTKILGFSVPPSMVEEVEQIAQEERRTKSELFREMLRVYQAYRQLRSRQEMTDPLVGSMTLEGSGRGKDAPA